MLHYIPRSVQIPENSKLGRVFPKNVTRRGKTVLDVKTIFYDVIFLRRENCVLGLGPPLFNLKNELFPAKFLVDGKSVKFQMEESKRQFFFRSEKLSFTPQNVLQVTFCFRHFESKVNVNLAHIDCAELENDRKLSISTLQKDNNLEWIKDWILWHSRLYKVTQVILYDNGSSNQKALVSMLKSLRSEVNIVFVEWSFIYGVSPYFCAQIGALNHCRLMFGASNGDVENRYCINLDIDEYLVYLGSEDLQDYLDRTIGGGIHSTWRCISKKCGYLTCCRINSPKFLAVLILAIDIVVSEVIRHLYRNMRETLTIGNTYIGSAMTFITLCIRLSPLLSKSQVIQHSSDLSLALELNSREKYGVCDKLQSWVRSFIQISTTKR